MKINICNEKDCLLHPSNNHTPSTYSSVNSSGTNNLVGWSPIENTSNIIMGDVIFKADNYMSELIIELKKYEVEIPIECLFCNRRNKMDMKNEILKRKAKKLLEE